MKAIILAAGQGTRLIPLTAENPKTLVRAAGRPILQHQIEAYLGAGIAERDIFVVAGYLADKIRAFVNEKYDAVNIIENTEYMRTNNMYSLYLALRQTGADAETACISNGDCVYEKSTVKKFAEDARGNLVACKAGIFNDEAMKISVSSRGNITGISKELGRDAFGLSMDLFKMNADAQARLAEIMQSYFARHGKNDWNEMALPELFGERDFEPFDAKDSAWTEIDNLADLREADRLFSPLRLARKTCLVMDWDGTLFLGQNPIAPAVEFVKCNAQRYAFFFLSNNTSLLPQDLSEKLRRHGVSFGDAQFITPLAGIAKLFAEERIQRAFVLANSKVLGYLSGMLRGNPDLQCRDAKKCEAVVLCYDTEMTYEKLKTAALLLHHSRIRYVATHLDRVCPLAATANGRFYHG